MWFRFFFFFCSSVISPVIECYYKVTDVIAGGQKRNVIFVKSH